MTHLLDTSALLAHYLGEAGAERVQDLFENESVVPGTVPKNLLRQETLPPK